MATVEHVYHPPHKVATCAMCGQQQSVRRSGVVWGHNAPRSTDRCAGSNVPPKRGTTREAPPIVTRSYVPEPRPVGNPLAAELAEYVGLLFKAAAKQTGDELKTTLDRIERALWPEGH